MSELIDRGRTMKRAIVIVGCVWLGGCATITQGSTQVVQINSDPQGADCSLTRQKTLLTNVVTPKAVTVPRSVYDVDVACRLPDGRRGKAVLNTSLTPLFGGNILIGGVIGAGVDAASGAMNQYPDSITVTIPERATTPKSKSKPTVPDPYRSQRKPVS